MYAETQNFTEGTMTNQELIDKYLAGQMTEEEKLQFERLLSADDSSLRDEMELQKEIILAIRRRALKEMLQREEEREHKVYVRRLIGWTSGSITALAAAAIVIFMIVIAPVRDVFYNSSLQYSQSLQTAEATRGDELDEVAALLEQANEAVLTSQWQQADKLALQVMERCTQPPADLSEELCVEYYQQAEWLHANYLMHSGRALAAKRLLKHIAKSEGLYSLEAQEILNQLDK